MKIAFVVLLSLVHHLTSATHAQKGANHVNHTEDSVWKTTYDLLLECTQKPSIIVCLKLKAVKYLDKAVVSKDPFVLMDYLNFARDPKLTEDDNEKNETSEEIDVEGSLPRSLDEQSGLLDSLIQDKIASIFQKRTLQLSIPLDYEEGRGKKKQYGAALLIGLGMAGMIGQLIMGKIALIAGKALVIAKVALVLSGIVGLKKLFGKGNEGETSVVYAAPGGGGEGGWHRSLSDHVLDAHAIAYNSYAPSGEQTTT